MLLKAKILHILKNRSVGTIEIFHRLNARSIEARIEINKALSELCLQNSIMKGVDRKWRLKI